MELRDKLGFIEDSPLWIKGTIGLIIVMIAALVIISFSTKPDRSLSAAADIDRSPTVTSTLTSTPVPRSTLLPTATSTGTSTPVPTVTPTPRPVEVAQPAPTGRPVARTAEPSSPTSDETGETSRYTYKIVNTYPHDPQAFTQGLIFEDGILYEGTGRRGQSTLRKVVLETGQVFQHLELPDPLFGEGVTIFGDRIIQLTWQAHIGFVYDKDSFELQDTFSYPTEGWGITHDGERLIMSDGTATLYFWDPETLEEIGRVDVYDETGPVKRLNELEYIQGELYANVWQTDRIARIDPESGRVTAWIDLTGLLNAADRTQPVDVLNGIAYDPRNGRLFVTGKLWPRLFEIELIPVEEG